MCASKIPTRKNNFMKNNDLTDARNKLFLQGTKEKHATLVNSARLKTAVPAYQPPTESEAMLLFL
jgi:hypothetical protein